MFKKKEVKILIPIFLLWALFATLALQDFSQKDQYLKHNYSTKGLDFLLDSNVSTNTSNNGSNTTFSSGNSTNDGTSG